SYLLRPGDVIRIREKSRKMEPVHNAMRRITDDTQQPWLDLDKASMSGTFLAVPQRAEIPEEVNEQLVVELYSK
ncbi:MAG: 30S ribosomal protein S4, partial [Candidatus Neomarinimicrobiota bacterium]